jgi:hypothetical protein
LLAVGLHAHCIPRLLKSFPRGQLSGVLQTIFMIAVFSSGCQWDQRGILSA